MKVVFSASKSIGGSIIRFGTMSDWCHVDILFDDGTLIGATGNGVQRMSLDDRLNRSTHPIYQYRIDEIKLDESKARSFAEAQLGKPYDYSAVFAFAVPWRTHWADDSKWFCSELVAATINASGTLIARETLSRVTPAFLDISPLLVTVQPTIKR